MGVETSTESSQSLNSRLEMLTTRDREDLMRLYLAGEYLESLYRDKKVSTNSNFWSNLSGEWHSGETLGIGIDYYPRTGFYTEGPATALEVYNKFRGRGYTLGQFLKSLENPSASRKAEKILASFASIPVDVNLDRVEETLRNNYRKTATALLNYAGEPVLGKLEHIGRAQKLAQEAGITLPDREIKDAKKFFHQKNLREQLGIAKKGREELNWGALDAMGAIQNAVNSAIELGMKDFSFAQRYAEEAVAEGLLRLQSLARKNVKDIIVIDDKPFDVGYYEHLKDVVIRAAHLADIDVQEQVGSLDKQYRSLVQKAVGRSKSPFWKRPFIK